MGFVFKKKDHIVFHRVDLGDLFLQDDPKSVFVVLKEPPSDLYFDLIDELGALETDPNDPGKTRAPSRNSQCKAIGKILSQVIEDHNFHDAIAMPDGSEKETKLGAEEVALVLKSKFEVMTRIMAEYLVNVIFTSAARSRKLAAGLETLPEPSSEEST